MQGAPPLSPVVRWFPGGGGVHQQRVELWRDRVLACPQDGVTRPGPFPGSKTFCCAALPGALPRGRVFCLREGSGAPACRCFSTVLGTPVPALLPVEPALGA